MALNREDVVIGKRSGSVVVRKGKGNVARTVPLPVEARLQLSPYLETRTDDHPAFFLSNYQRRISVRSVQRVLEKFEVHPHQLPHTYCRELVRAGVDICYRGGASRPRRYYAKPSVKELEQAIEKTFRS